jgi:hypothetical protein
VPERFTAAAAGLERVESAAAQVAYKTAYTLGQKEAAARFESAIQALVDFADVCNNLVQVRLEQGR